MNVSHASWLNPRRFLGLLALLIVVASSAAFASAATSIRILRGAGQQTTYGAAFPSALVVWVTDSVAERAVAGLRVDFFAGSGIGLSSSYAITDEYGLASVFATGLAACHSEVSAEVPGSPYSRVTFRGLVVNKAMLTVVPGDLKSTAGGPIPVATSYRFKGFVNGDTEETAQITGAPILTTSANNHSPHASYAIKGSVGSLSAPNYTFEAGFGTLAVLDDLGSAGQNVAQEAIIVAPETEPVVEVRPALVGVLEALTMLQPNFIAGLRGESGVFVRAAIWSNPLYSSAQMKNLFAQAAIGNLPLANTRNGLDESVRPVVLPHIVTKTAMAKTYSTRSAIPAMVTVGRRDSEVTVRAAFATKPSEVLATVPYSSSGSAIRKAFNPPGNE